MHQTGPLQGRDKAVRSLNIKSKILKSKTLPVVEYTYTCLVVEKLLNNPPPLHILYMKNNYISSNPSFTITFSSMSGGSSTRYRTQIYPRVRTNLFPIITPATTTIPITRLVIIPIHSFEIGVVLVVCGVVVDVTDCDRVTDRVV